MGGELVMKIKQLVFTRESIFDYALRSDVYIVSTQISFFNFVFDSVGLAFKSIKNMNLPELIAALENNEVALVEVTGCNL